MISSISRNVFRKFEQCLCSSQNRFYSAMKNPPQSTNKSSEKNNQIDYPDTRGPFAKKFQDGITIFGTNWKLYVEDFVIKNLRPDIVPKSYKMCYRSGLETYANFSITGAFVLSLATPLIFWNLIERELSTYSNSEIGILTFGSLATIVSIYFICLKVPVRMYYSEEVNNFLVVMPRLLPYTTTRITVKPGQLLPPSGQSSYFPWVNLAYTHTTTKKKIIISEDYFELPMYYKKLMGY